MLKWIMLILSDSIGPNVTNLKSQVLRVKNLTFFLNNNKNNNNDNKSIIKTL